jgi:gluconolactonase
MKAIVPDPIRELATGLAFPEGPVALSDGSVLVVEIGAGSVTVVPSDDVAGPLALVGGGPNGAAVGPDGAVYVANNGGFLWTERDGRRIPIDPATHTNEPPDFDGGWIERVDRTSGTTTVLYRDCDGRPLRGPNDLVFDAEGGMWFTDHGKGRHASVDRGGLYYAAPDGSSIVEAAFPLLSPNGVGLSPDGTRVYVAETLTGRIWEWELDGPGVIRPRATSLGIRHGGRCLAATPYSLDSLAVEAGGNLVIGALGDGLCVISPDGVIEELVGFPGDVTTNVCFRGTMMNQAVVTLSGSGRLVEIEWPRPGLELAFSS